MTPLSPRRLPLTSTFTLPELAIVLVVIVVLALLTFPAIARAKAKANRIHCVSHLKNLGLGLRIFSTDHNRAWPWQVSTNKGGSKEFLNDPSLAWPHFLSFSNEVSTPKIARCPSDRDAVQPDAWADARTNADLRFDNSRHEQDAPGPGNILFGDGSVQQVTSARLREALFVPGYPNSSGRRLLIP